ncbi:WXG100 family type VII secretion target [Saccharopolyspora sp. NFXS83]|uniref:WXG100 family type VII secretion target n=1 Tax=Saccharopolyspora sp. NFXS83 TaxID=2993560 RepID=UPI00224B13FF|nr:WXG100 family type VII secretion target [Saccharopolyspora sp. NFXS83]MCX2731503.1 WXG100 family type VII secretion target [Saccharopolyspora sp. NFXS83]
MAEDFYLDPDGMHDVNQRIKTAHDELATAFDELTSELAELHGCWGTDDVGKAFEKNYDEPAKNIDEGSKGILEGVDELTVSLDDAVETFVEQDAQNSDNIKNTEYES